MIPRRFMTVATAFAFILTSSAIAQQILYVDAAAPSGGNGLSWATAFNDLRDAIDAAQGSGGVFNELWVVAGEYLPDRGTLDRAQAFPMHEGIAIYGGFAGWEFLRSQRNFAANPTILSGDLQQNDGPLFSEYDDNSYHVLSATNVRPSARIDGFIIRGGSATFFGGDDSIGAALAINRADPTIVNCVFLENQSHYGGALSIYQGAPLLRRCSFVRNRALTAGGAIYATAGSMPVFLSCTFDGNEGQLQGGAAAISSDCIVDFQNCGFYGNSAVSHGAGAILTNSSYLACVNCVFSGNMSSSTSHGGGGVRNERGGFSAVNCTFYGNTACLGGGIYTFFAGNTVLRNTLLWDNWDATGYTQQAQLCGAGAFVVANSCIQGWDGTLGGSDNFGFDPLLIDPDGPDDVLGTPDDLPKPNRCMSPCSDTGGNSSIPLDIYDLDEDGNKTELLPIDFANQLRLYNLRVDIGAYENNEQICCVGDLDRDGDVDIADLAQLLAHYGMQTGAIYFDGDLDFDGDVDIADLAVLLSMYGMLCP